MPVFRGLVSLVLIVMAMSVPIPMLMHAQSAATITIGMTDLPTTLDPGEAYNFNSWEVLSHLYTGLTRQVPGTVDYELALARSVSVSADRLTYSFTLRDGLAFSDGTSITAQTFVDSLDRVIALRRDASKAVEPYVASARAATDNILVFTLRRPVPYFLALVSLPPYFPQHPDLARTAEPQPFASDLIGNGPYLLTEFATRDHITLSANLDYDLGPLPVTPTIRLQYFERSQDLRDAIRSGEIDVAWRALYLGHLMELEADPNLQIIERPGARVFYMHLNHNREPFDDPSARRGITLMLNRQPIITANLLDHVTPMTSIVPSEFAASYAPIWPDGLAMTEGETVLSEAGYRTRGQAQLQFNATYSQQTYGQEFLTAFTQLLRRNFNDSDYVAGSLTTNVERDVVIESLERGEGSEATFFAWNPIVPHPAAYLYPLAHSDSPIARSGAYATPEIDALLDEAALLDDPAEAGARYRNAQALLLDGYDIIPIWQEHLFLVAALDITGIQIESNYYLHYDQLGRE